MRHRSSPTSSGSAAAAPAPGGSGGGGGVGVGVGGASENDTGIVNAIEERMYKDYSRVPPPPPSSPTSSRSAENGNNNTFPSKLHRLLSDADASGVIEWMPHGRAWKIVDQARFAEGGLLNKYFDHRRVASFMRQVNGWGFRRVSRGVDANAYYHERFLRGLPHLVQRMVRAKPRAKSRRRVSAGSSSSGSDGNGCGGSETPDIYGQLTGVTPDFYRISEQFPLSDVSASAPQQQPQSQQAAATSASETDSSMASETDSSAATVAEATSCGNTRSVGSSDAAAEQDAATAASSSLLHRHEGRRADEYLNDQRDEQRTEEATPQQSRQSHQPLPRPAARSTSELAMEALREYIQRQQSNHPSAVTASSALTGSSSPGAASLSGAPASPASRRSSGNSGDAAPTAGAVAAAIASRPQQPTVLHSSQPPWPEQTPAVSVLALAGLAQHVAPAASQEAQDAAVFLRVLYERTALIQNLRFIVQSNRDGGTAAEGDSNGVEGNSQ